MATSTTTSDLSPLDRVWAQAVSWVEQGWVPDAVVAMAVRRMAEQRLREQRECFDAKTLAVRLASGAIAERPDAANAQHYEVPAEFFEPILGPRLKYSSCWWEEGITNLGEAEEAMLRLSCARAGVRDGMRLLDLGCGWGSLAIWLAENYPNSEIVAVSNSAGQRRYIEAACRTRELANVSVCTADVNEFRPEGTFDRVLSVEMFEHVRNHARLLERIAGWLATGGKLFVHIFTHREYAYTYEDDGEASWMARWFFTGGMMPSQDWLGRFDRDLGVEQQWRLDGTHYEKTLLAWLERLDAAQAEVLPILKRVYGRDQADVWLQRWRLFFLGSAATFGYDGGSEWGVSHYLLSPEHANQSRSVDR